MASYVKFNQFVDDLGKKVHNLDTDTLKVALTNSAPNAATNAVIADITQIANGNGYTTGGEDTQNTYASSSGTGTLTGTNVTWTSASSGMAAFRYVVLYNDTPTSPADPLVGYWDYGSSLTLAVGETFTVKFNNGGSSGTILTIA